MPDLLCRGKCSVTKELIYGYYLKTIVGDKEVHCIIPLKNLLQLKDSLYQVDPETVGQYIGLDDKNDKKIFEGDILSAHLDDLFPENETRLVVKFHDGAFRGWNLEFQTWDDLGDGFAAEFKIIGNIHDNPELLEVQRNANNES